MIRAAPAVMAAALSLSCSRPSEIKENVKEAARAPAPAAPISASPIAPQKPRLRLTPGVKFTLVPNLPDVAAEDLPDGARRTVEVLSFDGTRLRLRWGARVRIERPDSARRRADWVRAATASPRRASPTPPAPVYDEKEVTGTLDFPDFKTATGLLLPGLWPEGSVTLKGSTAMWIPGALARELRAGRSEVPFFPPSPLVPGPAADLLHRAAGLARTLEVTPSAAPSEWLLLAESSAKLLVDGKETEVATLRAQSWFGLFEVLADEENPVVLSVLPAPAAKGPATVFAPANVLRALLAYRVAEIETHRPDA